jgi:hypothetical protein
VPEAPVLGSVPDVPDGPTKGRRWLPRRRRRGVAQSALRLRTSPGPGV